MNALSSNFHPEKKIESFPSTLRRKPVRINATITWQTHQLLLDKSDKEGRSLSNLIAYLLEKALEAPSRPV